jgi:hypothetical protein
MVWCVYRYLVHGQHRLHHVALNGAMYAEDGSLAQKMSGILLIPPLTPSVSNRGLQRDVVYLG